MKHKAKTLRLRAASLFLMVGLIAAPPLAAQTMPAGGMSGMGGMMMGGMMGKHMQMHGNVPVPMLFKKAAMRVPAEKMQAFKKLKRDVVPAWMRQQTEVKIARMMWKERLTDPKATEKDIRKAYAQLTQEQEKLNRLSLNAALKLRNLLGPETFASLFQPGGMMGMQKGAMGMQGRMQPMPMQPMMNPGTQTSGTSR